MSLFSNRRVDDRKQILHAIAPFGRQDLGYLTASCNRSAANFAGDRDTGKAVLPTHWRVLLAKSTRHKCRPRQPTEIRRFSFIQTLRAAPTVSAMTAPRCPSGFSEPIVESRAV